MTSQSVNAGKHKSTRDHIIPRIRGGANIPGNTVNACYECNQDKGRLTIEEYRLVIAFRRGLISKDAALGMRFEGEQI